MRSTSEKDLELLAYFRAGSEPWTVQKVHVEHSLACSVSGALDLARESILDVQRELYLNTKACPISLGKRLEPSVERLREEQIRIFKLFSVEVEKKRSMVARWEEKEREYKSLEEKINHLNSTLLVTKRESIERDNLLTTIRNDYQNMVKELTQLSTERERLQSLLAQTQQTLGETSDQCRGLIQENSSLKSKFYSFSEEVRKQSSQDSLSQQLAMSEKLVSSLKEKLGQYEHMVQREQWSSQEINRLRGLLDSSQRQVNSARQDQQKEAEIANKAMADSNSRLQEIHILKTRIIQLESEVALLNSKLGNAIRPAQTDKNISQFNSGGVDKSYSIGVSSAQQSGIGQFPQPVPRLEQSEIGGVNVDLLQSEVVKAKELIKEPKSPQVQKDIDDKLKTISQLCSQIQKSRPESPGLGIQLEQIKAIISNPGTPGDSQAHRVISSKDQKSRIDDVEKLVTQIQLVPRKQSGKKTPVEKGTPTNVANPNQSPGSIASVGSNLYNDNVTNLRDIIKVLETRLLVKNSENEELNQRNILLKEKIQQLEESIFFREQQEANTMPSPSATRLPREAHHHNQHTSTSYVTSQQAAGQIPQAIMQEVQQYIGEISRLSNIAYQLDSTVQNQALSISQYAEQLTTMTRKCYELEQSLSGAHNELTKVEEEKKVLEEKLKEEVENRENDQELQLARAALKAESEMYTKQVTVLTKRLAILEQRVKEESTRLSSIKSSEREHELHLSNLNTQIATLEREGAARIQEKAIELAICKKLAATAKEKLEVLAKEKAILEKETISTKNRVRMAAEETRRQLAENALLSRFVKELENIPSGIPPQDVHKHLMMIGELSKRIVSVENKLRDQTVKLKEFQEEEEALMTQLLVIISRVCEAELEDNDNQEENRIEEFYDALDATSDRLINVIKVNDALEEENIRDIQYIRRTIGDMNNNLLQIGILAHMVKELLRIPPGPQQDEYNRYIEVAAELTAKLSRSESIITAQTADIVEQAETEKRLAKEVLELAERLRDRGYSPHSSDRSRIDRRTEDILDIRRDVETLAKIVKKEIGSHSEIPSRDGETNQQVTFAQSVNTQSQVQISSLKKRVEELEVQVRKDLDMIALLTSILEEAEKEIKEYRQEHAELRRAKEERTLLESKILKLETLANTQQGLNKEGKEELAKYKELAMEANEKYKSLLVVMSEKDKQAEAEAKARLEERKKVEQLTKKIQELEQIPPGVPAEQVQAHLSKISQLSNQLKETNTKLSTQQEQLQNLQKEEQDHINLLMTLTRKIKSLENEEMASPMIVQGKLRVEIDKYKNILEKTSGRIKTLGEQNKQLETLHNTDKAARDKAMTEANTHLQQVQLLTQKIRTLEQSSGEAKQEIDNYLHKVKDLTEKLSAAESDMMKKTSRIESFELSERRSKEEIMRLTDKIRTLEMENSRNEGLAGQKAEELTATKTQLEHALHTLQKERDQRSIIEEQKKFTEKQAAVAKQESDKYFKQIHELQAKITQVDSSRGVDKEEMDSLILSVSKLNNKISELEDQNNFLSSESYKLKVERDDLKKQTESLTKEMDELRLSYSKSVVAPPPTILPVQPPSSRTDSALAPSFINESVVMNKETAQQKGEDINVIVLESINLDSRIGEEEVLTEELAALTTWISEHPQAGVLQPLQNQLEQKLKTLLTMRANVECKIREKRESFSISRQLTFLLALCKDLELLVPSRPAVIRNIASEIERLLMIRASAFSKVRVILMVAALVADYLNNQAMSPAERSMLEKVIADSSEELKHLEITLRNAENELVRNETELRQHLMQANTLVLENLQQLRTPEQTSDDRVNRLKALSERLTAVEKGSPAKLDIPPLVLSGTSREIAENARSLLARLFTRAASRAELSLYRKMIAALAAQTKTLAQTIINPESSGVIEGSQNLSGLEAQIAELTVCLNDLQNVIRIKQSPGQKDKAEVQKFVGILLNRMVPVPSGSLEYSSGLGLEQSKLSPEDIDLYRDMLKEASQREREKVSVPMFESQTLSPSPMMRGRGLRNQLKSPSDDKSQLSLVYSLSDQLGVLENKLDEQSQLLSKMEREKESQFARLSFISDQLANPSAERSSHLQPLLKEATQRLKKITEEEKKIKDARKALIISAQAVLEEGKKKLGSLSYIPPLQQVESKDVTPRNAGSPTAGLQAIAALIQQFTDSEVFLKKSQDELERWKQADMKFEEPFTKVAQIVDSEIQSGNEPILREQLRHLGASFQTFKAPSEYNREEVNTYGNDFAQREAVLMIRIKELEEEVAKFREESGLTKAEEEELRKKINVVSGKVKELEKKEIESGLSKSKLEEMRMLKSFLKDYKSKLDKHEKDKERKVSRVIREGGKLAEKETELEEEKKMNERLNSELERKTHEIEQITSNLNSLRAVSEAAFGQLEQLHDREDMYKSQIEQLTSRAEELEQTGQAYAGLAGKEHEQIMTLKAKLNDAVRRARQATLEQNRTKHILEKIREQSGQQRAAPVTQIVQQPQQQPADVSQYVSQIEQLTANLNSLRAVSEAAFGQLEQLHDREDMYKSQIEQLTSRAEELEQTGQAYAGLAGKEHEQIMTLKAKLNDAVRRARQATLEQNRTKHILEKIREQSGQQRAAPVTQIVQQPQQQPADVSQYVSQIEQLTANLNSLRAVSEAAFGQLEQLHDREDMYKSQIEQLTSRAEELEQTGQAYAGLAGKEHEQIMTLKAKLNDAVRRARQATLEQNRTKHILEKIREQSGQQRAAPVTQIVQQPQQQPADVSQYVSQIEQLTANLNSLRAVSEAAFGQLEQLHDREDMYKSQIEQLTSRAEELEQTGQAYAGLAGKEHEQIMTLKAKLNDAVRRARQATLEQNRTKHILEKIREQSGQQRAAPVTQIVQQPQQQPADVSQYVSQIEQLTANLNSLRAVSEAAFGQLEQLHDREDMYKSQIEQLTSRAEELEQTGQAYAGLAGKEHEQIMTLKAKLNDAVRRARQATLEQNRTKHILEKIREQSGQQRAAPVTQIVQQPQQQPADVSQYVSQIEQLTANLNSLRAVSEAAFGQLEQLHDREDMYKSQIEQLTSRAEELEQTGQAYAGLAGKEHEQIMTLKAKLNDAVRRARQATLEQNRTKHILEKIREQSGQQRAAPVTQIVQQPQQQPADVSQYVSQIEQLTANLNSLRAVSEAAFGQLEQLHDREDMYKSQIEQLTSRAEELEQTGQAYAGLAGKEHEQIMTLKAKLNDAVRRARQATLEQNRTKHILEKIREQSGQQRAAPVTQIVQQPQQQPADVSQYVSQIEQLTANLNSLRAVSEAAFGQLEQLHDREDMYKSQIEQLTSRAEELEQTGQAYAGLAGKEHEQIMTLKAKLNDAVRRARQATLEQNRTKHILEKIREQSGQQRAAPVTQIVQQPQQQPADVSQYVSQIEQLTANLNSLRAVSEAAFGQLEQLHDREDMYKSQIEQLTSRAEELEQTGQAYAGLAGKEQRT
jgi:chromosome segregation ATPase